MQIAENAYELINVLVAHAAAGAAEAAEICRLLQSCEGLSCSTQLFENGRPTVYKCAVVVLAATNRRGSAEESLFRDLQQATPAPIIVADVEGSVESIVRWIGLGAADYLTPPWSLANTLPRIRRAALLDDAGRLAPTSPGKPAFEQMIGRSPAFQAVIDRIPAVSSCDAPVLISGETGTGKELCARAVHYLGRRSGKPFVPLNCGAIPAELVENELFGHAAGAYTGANARQSGLIEEAEGGSLFLDEVDSLPLPAQVKLLRFLQSREYRPLGVSRMATANVRVIAATNTDISAAVADGRLRLDLFYRLNVLSLSMPALRHRRDDIPLLAEHFLKRFAREYGKAVSTLSEPAVERLILQDWPGNVRELENVIARGVALATSSDIDVADLELPDSGHARPSISLRTAKGEFERAYIEQKLRSHRGNISQAARAAGKNRRSFWELIRKHRIEVEQFRAPLA